MRPPGRMFFYICEMKYTRMGYARMKVGENKIQEVEKTKYRKWRKQKSPAIK